MSPTTIPGLQIERRTLLQIPALAAACALPGLPRRTDGAEHRIGFDTFVELCSKLAARHLRGGRINPDVYLSHVAALGSRLDPSKVPEAKLEPYGRHDPPVEFGDLVDAPPMLFVLWRLAPNAVLPAHPHTPSHVYSLCLEGRCRVRHFEIAGAAPPPGGGGKFRIRETLDKLLRPGLGSSLTPDRDNIHAFTAGPEGALGLDINAVLPEQGPFLRLEYDEREPAGFDWLYDARWV